MWLHDLTTKSNGSFAASKKKPKMLANEVSNLVFMSIFFAKILRSLVESLAIKIQWHSLLGNLVS